MAEPDRPALSVNQVKVIAVETGATEEQIREIVRLIGTDRASIIREARSVAKAKK